MDSCHELAGHALGVLVAVVATFPLADFRGFIGFHRLIVSVKGGAGGVLGRVATRLEQKAKRALGRARACLMILEARPIGS